MSSTPKTILITGANRGIGLGLVQQILLNPKVEILIATTRSLQNSEALRNIQDTRLKIMELDVTNDQSLDKFVKNVDEILGNRGLNCLVNNAGVKTEYFMTDSPSRDLLTEQFDINCVSVVLLTQRLLPFLKRAASLIQGSSLSASRAAIINISSTLGSIELNEIGTTHSPSRPIGYRMSKAALNQFTKTMAIDLKNEQILVVGFCPGWVRTGLGGPNAFFSVEESTSELSRAIEQIGEQHNGGFFRRDMERIPY